MPIGAAAFPSAPLDTPRPAAIQTGYLLPYLAVEAEHENGVIGRDCPVRRENETAAPH
jgi:hypothetical protein